jgi:SAM-dependent methyltransferase
VADWDAYWRAVIADDRRLGTECCRSPISPFFHLVDWLPARPWKRVLVVGCGVSTEMFAIWGVGYHVVAFDISSVAIEYRKNTRASKAQVAWWFQVRGDLASGLNVFQTPEEALAKLPEVTRERGTLEWRCADFRDVSDTGFDVVYCPWSWQCLDEESRAELPRWVARRLVPGGACRVVAQNLNGEGFDELVRVFSAAGMFLREDDDAKTLARLDAGERMFDLFNSSG